MRVAPSSHLQQRTVQVAVSMRSASLPLAYRRLVSTAKQLARAGVEEEPRWLQALERCPPVPQVHVRKPKPKPIVFPEDRFIQGFYDRFPHARQAPIDLKSREPALPRRYALRQLELVEQGRTPKQARRIVDAEFKAEGLLNPPSGRADTALKQVQLEEEASLQDAMLKMSRT